MSATKREAPYRNDILLERVLYAPRRLLFEVWTDPESVAQWWGPHGFTNPLCELDARPGGRIRIHMRGPDGTIYPMSGVYREVVPAERLVFASAALDERGNPRVEVLATVTLAERGGETTQRVRARVVKGNAASAPYVEGMEAGWVQSLERLESFLGSFWVPARKASTHEISLQC